MRSYIRLIPALIVLALATESLAQAQEDDPSAFLAAVTAHWRQRRANVKTVMCVAEVDRLFPKQSLSEFDPPEDASFTGEPVKYMLDLAGKRCRKYSNITNAWKEGERFTLKPEELSHVYDGEKYRLFRVKNSAKKLPDTKYDDVVMYEDGVHSFFFNGSDMPLFWTFGSLTNRHPMPARLLNEIPFDRFKVGDVIEVNGRKLRALTTQEQDSPTAVREFLVDIQSPYLIRRCSSREGNRQNWTIEAFYGADTEESLSQWTSTSYLSGLRQTYRVKELSFNSPLNDKLFDTSLTPGQTAYSAPDNQTYRVGDDQTLLPYTGEPLPKGKWWWRIGLGAVVLVLVMIAFSVRSRKAMSKVKR